MTNIKLAASDSCTGCGACAFRCHQKCITMRENEVGIVLPEIDTGRCIGCHSCENVCPVLNPVKSSKPEKAYAAWSNDAEERRTSASGGIAIEMYKYAVCKGYKVVGAAQDADFSVHHRIASNLDELQQFKNSKYVFSDAYGVFPLIKAELAAGVKVLFIGLPCQVAALRKLFRDDANLMLVEVVCHGTTPYSYLKQHIDMLSTRCGKRPAKMSFRDPYPYTYTYTLSLYADDTVPFYAKRTKDGDTYQFGYHRAVTYRENCYHCRFAKPERNADIVIADYHGLGLCSPCEFDDKKVSLVLENTDRGAAFVRELIEAGRIHAVPRPIEEPFRGEAQLRHPSVKTKYRLMFEREIADAQGDFEKAIEKPQRRYLMDNNIKGFLRFPKKVLRKIKKTIIG